MKPFDLEKAKAGVKLCTRDGRPARIISFDRDSALYPIVALIKEDNKDEYIRFYTRNGEQDLRVSDNSEDLFLDVKTKEGWVNVFSTPCGVELGQIHPTKEDALNVNESLVRRIDTIKIEWEE